MGDNATMKATSKGLNEGSMFKLDLKQMKASGNAEFGTIYDATNSFDIYIGSNKEFPMMGLR